MTDHGVITTTLTELSKALENAFLDIETRKKTVYSESGRFPFLAFVHYFCRYFEDRLTVKVDPDGTGDFKKTCFEVDGVKLPTGLYVGFTSATGDLTDNHDVVSFKIWQLDSKNDKGEKRHEMKPEVLNLAPKESMKGLFCNFSTVFNGFFRRTVIRRRLGLLYFHPDSHHRRWSRFLLLPRTRESICQTLLLNWIALPVVKMIRTPKPSATDPIES